MVPTDLALVSMSDSDVVLYVDDEVQEAPEYELGGEEYELEEEYTDSEDEDELQGEGDNTTVQPKRRLNKDEKSKLTSTISALDKCKVHSGVVKIISGICFHKAI